MPMRKFGDAQPIEVPETVDHDPQGINVEATRREPVERFDREEIIAEGEVE